MCLKRLQVNISKLVCIYVHKDCFVLVNSAGPDVMPPYHLGLHCLPKYLLMPKEYLVFHYKR